MEQNQNPIVLMSLTHAIAVFLAFVAGIIVMLLPRLRRLTVAVVCLMAAPLPLVFGMLPLSIDLAIVYLIVLIFEMITGALVWFRYRKTRQS